jgi:hypothetical protein
VNPGLMTIIPNKGPGVMGAPVILVPVKATPTQIKSDQMTDAQRLRRVRAGPTRVGCDKLMTGPGHTLQEQRWMMRVSMLTSTVAGTGP